MANRLWLFCFLTLFVGCNQKQDTMEAKFSLQTLSRNEVTSKVIEKVQATPLESLQRLPHVSEIIDDSGKLNMQRLPILDFMKVNSVSDDSQSHAESITSQAISKGVLPATLKLQYQLNIQSSNGGWWVSEVEIPQIGFVGQIWVPESIVINREAPDVLTSIIMVAYDNPTETSQMMTSQELRSTGRMLNKRGIRPVWLPIETEKRTISWLVEDVSTSKLSIYSPVSGKLYKLIPKGVAVQNQSIKVITNALIDSKTYQVIEEY